MKTLRCIFTNLKQVLTSPYFFAGVAIMAAVCFTENVYTGVNGKTYNVMEAFLELRDENFFGLTAENICCRSIGGYALMFMGVIASFPFVFISCGEQKSGLRFSVCREGVLNYSISKTVSAVISAGLVCGVGYLLFTGSVFLMYPSGEYYHPVFGDRFFDSYAMFLAGTVLSGMSVSTLPLLISGFTSNKYFCVCIPFLFDYLRMTVGNRLFMSGIYNNYDVISLIYPDYMSSIVWDNFSLKMYGYIIFICSVLIAFITVYFARKGRVDIGA